MSRTAVDQLGNSVNRLTVVAKTNTALEGMVGGFVSELRDAVYGGAEPRRPEGI